jgi:hypothetical protein
MVGIDAHENKRFDDTFQEDLGSFSDLLGNHLENFQFDGQEFLGILAEVVEQFDDFR